jgi:transposase
MAAKQVQWGRVRQSYMAGKSYKELSEKYGVSVKTIQNRASKEGWVKEKGKIEEEVGEKIHARIVRVRVAELEKLVDANGKLIDVLVDLNTKLAEQTGQKNFSDIMDKAGSMKNVECLAKAIQTAVQTQRDLFKLPTLDQDFRKKEAAQRKREMKAKLDLEREKWEAEKAKAENEIEADTEVWKIVAPEGVTVDG